MFGFRSFLPFFLLLCSLISCKRHFAYEVKEIDFVNKSDATIDSDVKWEDAYTCFSWSELPGLARNTITNCIQIRRRIVSGLFLSVKGWRNAFLVDERRSILMMGDPLTNNRIRQLYDKTIKQMNDMKKKIVIQTKIGSCYAIVFSRN